jgi:hypothetical protein
MYGAVTPLPIHFMASYLMKHKNNFNLTFIYYASCTSGKYGALLMFIRFNISGSHGSICEEYRFLGCNTM